MHDVTAIARQAAGDFALGVDDAVPRNPGLRVEMLEDAADKTGASGHAGHGGDLAVGCDPAFRDAADDGANRLDRFVPSGNSAPGSWIGPRPLEGAFHAVGIGPEAILAGQWWAR